MKTTIKFFLIFLLLFLLNACLSNQTPVKDKNIDQNHRIDSLFFLSQRTDSLIKFAKQLGHKQNFIGGRRTEGISNTIDNSGEGGFTTHIYINLKSDKLIKASKNDVMHYKSSESKPEYTTIKNIQIYYNDTQAYFTILKETKRTSKKILSEEQFFIDMSIDTATSITKKLYPYDYIYNTNQYFLREYESCKLEMKLFNKN